MLGVEDRARLAENQAYFREVNERIGGQARLLEGDEHLYRFLCECSNASCHVSVSVSLAEYREVRAHPGRYLLIPGHERLEVERIVLRTERFAVSEPM
jgi:formate-nitrite transporter family protein